jgi:hypothetical protein
MSRESFDQYMRRVAPPRTGIDYRRYLNGRCDTPLLWGMRLFPNRGDSDVRRELQCDYHRRCVGVDGEHRRQRTVVRIEAADTHEIVEITECIYHKDCAAAEATNRKPDSPPLLHTEQRVVLVDRLAVYLASQPTRRA